MKGVFNMNDIERIWLQMLIDFNRISKEIAIDRETHKKDLTKHAKRELIQRYIEYVADIAGKEFAFIESFFLVELSDNIVHRITYIEVIEL